MLCTYGRPARNAFLFNRAQFFFPSPPLPDTIHARLCESMHSRNLPPHLLLAEKIAERAQWSCHELKLGVPGK